MTPLMQQEIQKFSLIWPTALKRSEVDKVTQAGVTILRAVKGSNQPQLSTAPFRAVSCGRLSESISATQQSVFRWLPAYIQLALWCALEL